MTSTRRRLWRIEQSGSLAGLHVTEDWLPPPGPHQARVRVESVGLNFADIFACQGLYSATPQGPFTPGLEFAGVIEELGIECSGWCPGDRVMGAIRFGGYATQVNADVRYLYPLPDEWSYSSGAAFPAQALTAWYALVELAGVRRGHLVLVHSAAGGVGLLALSLMSALDVQCIATVGRPEKAVFLQEHCGLAFDQIVVRAPRDFPRQLDAALAKREARGFDAVLDALAGRYFSAGYDRLNPGGRVIIYGAASMMSPGARPNYLSLAWKYLRRPRPDPLNMISENRSVMGFNLIWLWEQHERFRTMLEQILALRLPPPHVGAQFGFDQAPEALRFLQSGRSVGKVILQVPPGEL